MLALCLVLSLSAPEAQAEERPAFVIDVWEAPERIAKKCRDSSHFEALTRERVGSSGRRESTLPVEVRIERADKRWRLRLTTKGAESLGERELFASRCQTLLETAAVVLSLALLPDYFQNERDNQVTVVRAAVSTSAQEQASDDELPIIPDAQIEAPMEAGLGKEPLDVGVQLSALGELGTLPQPGLGLGVAVHAQAASYQLAFRLSRWAEQQEFVEAREAGKGARFDYLAGTLQLCKTVWKMSGACALATVGRLSADAIEISDPRAQVNLMTSLGGALFVEARVPTWARFRLQADLAAHLLRPRYTIMVRPADGGLDLVEREIHQPSVVYGLVSVSWGLAF